MDRWYTVINQIEENMNCRGTRSSLDNSLKCSVYLKFLVKLGKKIITEKYATLFQSHKTNWFICTPKIKAKQ